MVFIVTKVTQNKMVLMRMPGLQRMIIRRDLNRQRVIRDRSDPRDLFSDKEFKRRFRFRKTSLYSLVELIGPDLFNLTERHFTVSGLYHFCLFYDFLAVVLTMMYLVTPQE